MVVHSAWIVINDVYILCTSMDVYPGKGLRIPLRVSLGGMSYNYVLPWYCVRRTLLSRHVSYFT